MSKTVGNLKDSVSGLLQGANLNNVKGLNGALERAARVLVQKADIPEASGKQSIVLYNGVFDYPIPSTIFGGAIIDIRPQGISRNSTDYVYKKPTELFDRTKQLLPNGYMVTFEGNNGVPLMRVAQTKAPGKVTLDDMHLTTGWTASGSASGLTEDDTVFYQSPSSLRFLATGASTAILTKTITSINLSSYEDVGVAFLALRVPTGTSLTSVELRIGSSSTNYNNVTQTQGFLGAFQNNEWMLLAFDLSQASQTGTPNFSALTYLQVLLTHSATMTNVRVGGLFIALPSPHDIIFQSAAIFSVAGTLSGSITDDNDTIILNDAAYTMYELECALTVALQSGGSMGAGLVASFNQQLHGTRARNGAVIQMGLYDQYRIDNPSEELRTVGSYYDQ